MNLSANWSYPTAVRFGAGRIEQLAEACAAAGMANPLLVTDRGLATLPITERARSLVDGAGFFTDVDPNPNEENLAAGIETFRDGKHDGVIAFGGGSALDLGKLIAFQAGQSRPVWDFEDIGDYYARADATAIAPIVAVPTTAGTGSEVGRAGVLTNSATHEKKIIFHPKMLPSVVIADPELTVAMPSAVTAGTGMDALAHCLEAYSSNFYHPMSQGIALEGIRLVLENLPRAFAYPNDIEARAHMMAAAAMGAVAFQKGLGAVHALSHPIGAIYGTHHGTTNAVLLVPVLHLNRPVIEARIEQLAAYCGIEGGFDGFVQHITALREFLGIPGTLGELGVHPTDLKDLVAKALADPTAGGNPVPLTPAAVKAVFAVAL